MQTSLFSNLKKKDIDIQYTPIKADKKLTGAFIRWGSVMYPEDWRFFPFSSASAILSSNQFSLDKNSYKSTGTYHEHVKIQHWQKHEPTANG